MENVKLNFKFVNYTTGFHAIILFMRLRYSWVSYDNFGTARFPGCLIKPLDLQNLNHGSLFEG